MSSMTNDVAKEVAVQCVSDYLNNGTSLNAGLAKSASLHGWNSEQLKRVVEATNNVAYLKSLQVAGTDRTGEFPLADYREIVKMASMPENFSLEQLDELAPVDSASIEKSASAPEDSFKIDPRLALHLLIKEAGVNERALEEARGRGAVIADQLNKVAGALCAMSDEDVGLALSTVFDETQFTKAASYVGHPQAKFVDYASYMDMRDEQATALQSLIKQAFEVGAEIQKREALVEQVYDMRMVLLKEAGLLGSVGSLISKAIPGKVKAMASNAAGAVANSPQTAARTITRGVVNTAIKPIKAVGGVIANGAKATIDTMGAKAQTMLSKTTAGKKMGVKPRAPLTSSVERKNKSKVIAGTIGTAAVGALDIPALNNDNNNVWNKLQG